MKALLFILLLNSFPHEAQSGSHNRYLKVVYEKDEAWVNICREGNKVKVVSLNDFMKAEPVITNSEGYELASELGRWSDSMRVFSRLDNKQIREEVLNSMLNIFSRHYYRKEPEQLSRKECLSLWVEVSRAIFCHHFRDLPLKFCEQSKEAALIGEMMWPLIWRRNSLLEDIMIFSIHKPGGFSVNLLLDKSGNIMTKVIIVSDIYYREEFSLSLLNKNSKALKAFATAKN